MEGYEFYEEKINNLLVAEQLVKNEVENFRKTRKSITGEDPVEYCKSRIKKPDSMKEKLARKGYDITLKSALTQITDAVGVRIVCDFMDDVYAAANYFENNNRFKVIKIKDYIRNPKPNGYRSYHLVLQINGGAADKIYCEIQIRTMAIDCWASLEHQIKYKHKVSHQELIMKELKRCANEIASTDLSMQTIRELIINENKNLRV